MFFPKVNTGKLEAWFGAMLAETKTTKSVEENKIVIIRNCQFQHITLSEFIMTRMIQIETQVLPQVG